MNTRADVIARVPFGVSHMFQDLRKKKVASVTDYYFKHFLPLMAEEGLFDDEDLADISNLSGEMRSLLTELDTRLLDATGKSQLSLASIESREIDISLQLPAGLLCSPDFQDNLADRYLLGANVAYLLGQGDFPTLVGIENIQEELNRRFGKCILGLLKKL